MVRAEALFERPRLATVGPQVDRLAQMGSPKMVLVGGSNLPYGLNSEMLSEAVGMPVMNMGIQGSLTLPFLLELIKPHLGEGDAVVLAAESWMYTMDSWSTTTLLRMAASNPETIRFMSRRQIVAMPLHLYDTIAEEGQQLRHGFARYMWGAPDFADGLTESGDYVGHRGKESGYVTREDQMYVNMGTRIPRQMREYLVRFKRYCNSHEIRLLVSHAPVARLTLAPEHLEAVHAFLKEHFEVVSDPGDYTYPDSAFYDMWHHLTFKMRDVRTRQLIADLRPYLH